MRWRLSLGLSAALSLAGAAPAPAWAQVDTSCIDVQIGSDRSYACLNRQLQREVPRNRFSAATDAPYSAASPAPQVGTFNQAATAERLGSNFGKSAYPQRPPPPVFNSPLIPAR